MLQFCNLKFDPHYPKCWGNVDQLKKNDPHYPNSVSKYPESVSNYLESDWLKVIG